MPSLFKFLITTGSIVAVVASSLYVLAEQFQPEPRVVEKTVPALSKRKPQK